MVQAGKPAKGGRHACRLEGSHGKVLLHCGAAGDNINLVELVNNTSFVESLNWFKENFDLELDITDKIKEAEKVHKEEDSSFYIKQMMLEDIVAAGHHYLFNEQSKDACNYLTGQRGYAVDNLKRGRIFVDDRPEKGGDLKD